MPIVSALGAMSSRGLGEFAQSQASSVYVEDVFSTYLYTGNSSTQTIVNGISLGTTIAQPVGTFSSNQAIAAANNAALLVGSFEDFTAECWVNQTNYNSNQFLFGKSNTSVGDVGNFLVLSSNVGQWNVWFNGSPLIYGSNTPQTNTWFHVAVSRSGSTVRLFVNGTNVGSGTYSGAITNTGTFKVGAAETAGFQYQLNGYVTNMRFVKGTALYTSNFTPPTSQLTAVSGTSLLTLQSPSLFVDNSPNNITITNYSVASTTMESPFVSATPANGGLVWIKSRSTGSAYYDNVFYDTTRGVQNAIVSSGGNSTAAQANNSAGASGVDLYKFTNSGFALGTDATYYKNYSGATFASWTFRKQSKFFDIVTYTGNGIAGRTISHNLGSVPGMIIVKTLSKNSNWMVYHRASSAAPQSSYLTLQSSSGVSSNPYTWNNTQPTATVFTVGETGQDTNDSGATYVAYLFAHNAGGFGADKTQNVISCGSAANGSTTVNLGYEPQWVMIKSTGGGSAVGDNWLIADMMRGLLYAGNTPYLAANQTSAENFGGGGGTWIQPTATGFTLNGLSGTGPFIYVAIRRGPMKTPTDATTVFNPIIYTGTGTANRVITTSSRPDIAIWASRTRTVYADNYLFDRLRGVQLSSGGAGGGLQTNTTAAEYGNASYQVATLDNVSLSLGASSGAGGFNYSGTTLNGVFWSFTRAPSFADQVCYTGTGFGVTQTLSHSLGVTPELIILKKRGTADGAVGTNWGVWSSYLTAGNNLFLNSNAAQFSSYLNITANSSTFADSVGYWNITGLTYTAYLFASCAGVSKVGTYTGTGATLTVNCGFSGGARYVLIKRINGGGNWWVWDSARGMVSGTDPRLPYDSTVAELNNDWVYTTSGGFQIVTNDTAVNASGGTYLYLAIA